MQKQVYLVPTTDICKEVVSSLNKLGISDEQIGVIARDDIPLDSLPDASYEDENDMVPAAKRGAVLGGAAGMLAGLTAVVLSPVGIVLGGAGVAIAAAGGASYGTFVSAMIGTSVPNSQLREYEAELEKGVILLIVELEEDDVDKINKELYARHPELNAQGDMGVVPPVL